MYGCHISQHPRQTELPRDSLASIIVIIIIITLMLFRRYYCLLLWLVGWLARCGEDYFNKLLQQRAAEAGSWIVYWRAVRLADSDIGRLVLSASKVWCEAQILRHSFPASAFRRKCICRKEKFCILLLLVCSPRKLNTDILKQKLLLIIPFPFFAPY